MSAERRARPLPNPPPQAGEGGDNGRAAARCADIGWMRLSALRSLFWAHDLVRKPDTIPDQVRDRLFRDNTFVRGRIFFGVVVGKARAQQRVARTMNVDRHREVRAVSAFTRIFDALWRASKGDGRGASAASFEGRFAATSG